MILIIWVLEVFEYDVDFIIFFFGSKLGNAHRIMMDRFTVNIDIKKERETGKLKKLGDSDHQNVLEAMG